MRLFCEINHVFQQLAQFAGTAFRSVEGLLRPLNKFLDLFNAGGVVRIFEDKSRAW